ncbi:hypothetical protein AVEN_23435-1 [Araneus ventricosus]|uniref:Uncharacterized protein n=1 Tax=Araneus ventricosus TaxID=182803 RepID=A0A4Y2E9C0_ARAVE|nr:hypothetical protein AVEN_23435-1 [Araneus ventricosus]
MDNQKKFYDNHHRVKDLEEFELGQVVWIAIQRSYWRIKAKYAVPRSYLLETPVGIDWRNRFHLRPFSRQLEYDQDDTTRGLPDFPRVSSPVPFPDEMRGSPSLSHSPLTTSSTFSAPKFPENFYEKRSARTVRSPDRLDLKLRGGG